ncbi:hypothetical protein QWZ13_15760 [Reinekea marina]|uniref:hypothetical protein n=1 Tax=Reinekea marina TaxID=1310421 RepID=UPI0025B36919|nr:hypothetical protein [Reinekea marina]MDN3650363.1 hypothetical protein [Reinekea marina]
MGYISVFEFLLFTLTYDHKQKICMPTKKPAEAGLFSNSKTQQLLKLVRVSS